MKEWNIYEIRDTAIRSKIAVFSLQQLANLINKPKKIASVYASRLVAKGLAQRLSSGKISFSDNEFVIASQFIEPAYISLLSALNIHGLITQIPITIECVTTKKTRTYSFSNYYHIQPNLFFGYCKQKRANSYIFIAEPEKAFLDGLYLNKINPEIFEDIRDKLDLKKIKKMLKLYKNNKNKRCLRVYNFFEGKI